MADLPRIVVKDLMKVYKSGPIEVIALRGIDLTIEDGSFVSIVGPSGSGKSTLLSLIGGLDRPTAGSIRVGNRSIVDFSNKELVAYRRNLVGMVFQFFNLVPVLTAEENIELPMLLSGVSREARQARTWELLDLVGLRNRSSHKVDELSGGEQQRVAIAVALANDPQVLLADEPTGELDRHTGEEMIQLFKRANEELGKTIIIATHDPRIPSLAGCQYTIEDGRIVIRESGS